MSGFVEESLIKQFSKIIKSFFVFFKTSYFTLLKRMYLVENVGA